MELDYPSVFFVQMFTLFMRIKVIADKKVRHKAAKEVLIILNFASMEGNSAAAKQLETKWLGNYEKAVARAMNEQRSYVQSRLKAVIYAYYKKNGNTMPPKELLLALIKRDFQVAGPPGGDQEIDPADHENLVWWITQVLPIASGNQSDWAQDHYLYMTVQEGHYPEDAKKLYVTDSTEAIAVWIIENNYGCWPAQWEAKEEHGDYAIQRKAKDDNGQVSLENSYVSDPF